MSRAGEFVLCVLVVPAVVLAILWVPLRTAGLGPTADFIQFYSAGKVVLAGNAPHLYELAQTSEVLRQFTHPPFEALLYAPFATLPFATAYLLWTYLSLACLGGIFFLLRVYGPPFLLPERLLLLAVAFFPVFACIVQGQDSVLALLAFTLAFLALRRERWFPAGMFLGLALIKPQIALPMAMFLTMFLPRRGRGRLVAGFALVAAALAGVSMLVFEASVLVEFPQMLLDMNRAGRAGTFHLIPEAMMNLRGAVSLLLGGFVAGRYVNVTVGVLSAGLLGWALRKLAKASSNREPQAFVAHFTFAFLMTLVISFHLLIHDASLMVLPVFLYLGWMQQESRSWNWKKARAAAPLWLFVLAMLGVQMAGSKKFAVAAFPLIWLTGAVGQRSGKAEPS